MAGIYIVDVPAERNLKTRYIVVATDAAAAEATVARAEGRRRMTPQDGSTFEVGRLGTYDPGMGGAALTRSSDIIAIDPTGA